jgi:uncharacterized protein YjiS (DUF1127 family)
MTSPLTHAERLPHCGGALPSLPRAAKTPSGLVDAILRLFATLALWQERAAQRYRLLGLDERMLKDLGISRADVEREAAKPVWLP